MCIKEGEPEGVVTKMNKDGEIIIPKSMLEKLGWKSGDEIDVAETEVCFDWGEVDGLILRNITKEK